jgi:hypothetical protein
VTTAPLVPWFDKCHKRTGTNTLAYYEHLEIMGVKRLDPGSLLIFVKTSELLFELENWTILLQKKMRSKT